MDAAVVLARHVVNTDYEDIPPEAVKATKRAVLDAFGSALAGSAAPGIKEFVELIKEWGGKKESTILAYGGKVPCIHAATANAAMVNARDYEDTHDAAVLHTEAPVVPAAFALAERNGPVDGKRVITAVALGIDLASRMGLAMTAITSFGWQRTPIVGCFSAAATAGKLLGLDEQKMINALGIAYSQASGNKQATDDGALSKRFQPGFASRAGVLAALMAEKGITGAQNSLEGPDGFYQVYQHGQYDRNALIADLGKRFEGVNLSYKPYPCCRLNHAYIDATLALVREHDIKPEDVEQVIVFSGEEQHPLLYPLDTKRRPRTLVDAQFSIPYTVSTAIVKRKVIIDDFSPEGIQNPVVLQMAQRVVPKLDPGLLTREIPPAVVEIRTRLGAWSKRVDFAYGNPNNPMTDEDAAWKFTDGAAHAPKPILKARVERAIEMIKSLEEVDDTAKIMAALS